MPDLLSNIHVDIDNIAGQRIVIRGSETNHGVRAPISHNSYGNGHAYTANKYESVLLFSYERTLNSHQYGE